MRVPVRRPRRGLVEHWRPSNNVTQRHRNQRQPTGPTAKARTTQERAHVQLQDFANRETRDHEHKNSNAKAKQHQGTETYEIAAIHTSRAMPTESIRQPIPEHPGN